MAEEDVRIEIGASVDKLKEAVEQAKNTLTDLTNHVRRQSSESAGHMSQIRFALQGLINPLRGIRENLGGLADAFIAAFAVHEIMRFVESMAQLGVETERTMAILGLTAEQTLDMRGMAELTGTSVEGLALSMERLSLNIQRSVRDSFNPAAQAMKVLHLNARDLVGLNADQYFEKLHETVSKFNPSLNLTNALMALGGRGVAQLLPLLTKSDEEWRKMRDAVKEANEGLAAAVPGMADTHARLSILGMTARAASAALFGELKPAIDSIINILIDFITWMKNAGKQGGALEGSLGLLAFAARSVASAFAAVLALLEALGTAAVAVMQLAFGDLDKFQEHAKNAVANLEAIGRSVKKTVEDIWSTPLTMTITKGNRGDAGLMDENARKNFDIQVKAIEGSIALWRGWQTQVASIYDMLAANYQITEMEKLRATQALSQKVYEEEVKRLEAIKALHQSRGMAVEAQADNQKILELEQKFKTDYIKNYSDMLKTIRTQIDGVFGAFQSSFNGQLRGLLAGTVSFKEAFKTIIGDMVIFFIQMVEKMVFEWIAGQIAMAVVGPAVAAPKIAAFNSQIMGDSALAYAGVWANLAPFLGPAAEGPAEAARANIIAQLAFVPKFEMGSDFVPQTGLAMVHQGERIITAQDNAKGGGVGETHLHIHAVDAGSIERMLMNNRPVVGKVIKRLLRDNQLALAGA